LEQFQQVSFFHLHTWVHSTCTIFTLLHPFPTSSPRPLVPTPPGRTCFTLLFSNFVEEKYVCIIAYLVHLLYFSSFYFSPFLMVVSKFYIHSCIESTTTIFIVRQNRNKWKAGPWKEYHFRQTTWN
jgi:hypothetical protein